MNRPHPLSQDWQLIGQGFYIDGKLLDEIFVRGWSQMEFRSNLILALSFNFVVNHLCWIFRALSGVFLWMPHPFHPVLFHSCRIPFTIEASAIEGMVSTSSFQFFLLLTLHCKAWEPLPSVLWWSSAHWRLGQYIFISFSKANRGSYLDFIWIHKGFFFSFLFFFLSFLF